MTEEKAIKIIEKELPLLKPTFVVYFDNKYIFRLVSREITKGTGGIIMMAVDNNGDVYTFNSGSLFDRLDEYEEAVNLTGHELER